MNPEEILNRYVTERGHAPSSWKALHRWAHRRKLGLTEGQAKRLVSSLNDGSAVAPVFPTVEGPGLEHADIEAAYRMAVDLSRNTMQREAQRRSMRLSFAPEPVGLVFVSDIHFGSPGTDYEAVRRDAELIARTPGMWAVFHGDAVDLYTVKHLAHARWENTPLSHELALLRGWLQWLGKKLLVVVAGNHDNWAYRLGGVSLFQGLLPHHVVYDPHEVRGVVEVGQAKWRLLVRHKVRYNSIYNALHGLKQNLRLGDFDADISVAGHVHRGATYEVWHHQGRQRLVILTGTYKVVDPYAVSEGFVGSGSGQAVAVVLDPRGRVQPFNDLTLAADFLTWLRKRELEGAGV